MGEQKKIREPVTGGRPYTWNRQAPQEKTRREPQEQMQRVSYFPPEDLWLRRFGTAAGWSEDADHWYRQTEDALRKKNFKPRTRKEWRESLKGPHVDALENPSTDVINRALGFGPHPTTS